MNLPDVCRLLNDREFVLLINHECYQRIDMPRSVDHTIISTYSSEERPTRQPLSLLKSRILQQLVLARRNIHFRESRVTN